MILNIIDSIGLSYPVAKVIYTFLGTLMAILVFHKPFYYVIGFFFTRKFKPAKKKHKYGILIAARNEKDVIGNLLDSINQQDYPRDLLTVFVVADNCEDDTAKIARKHGAIVYERFDTEHRTKGFALEYLLDQIEKDYGRLSFEGYFIFDADNLLKKDYISRMNDAFDEGCKIITSYRNTKNFDENWIASTYAIHWLRSIRLNHRARSVLRLATNIQGTGFLFKSNIVKDGWHYTSLTEDRAFTVDAVAQGYEITYQDAAEFYDEQPVSLKVAFRQRIRWAKGHLLAFKETGPYLFLNIFFGKLFIKKRWEPFEKKKGFWRKFVESIRHRFASFDTFGQLVPVVVVNIFRWFIVYVLILACFRYTNGIEEIVLFGGNTWLAKSLNYFTHIKITCNPGWNAFFISISAEILARIIYRLGVYFANTWNAIYVFIAERKRIKKISFWKKVLYTLTWPLFDIIGRYSTYIALFKKVEWKAIPHNSKITINDINNS